jgi:hypothetical protein
MAITSKASDTQTAVIDTEHTLSTETDTGVYVLCVDLANMVAGDVVVLKLKTKAITGGTSRLAYSAMYANAQAAPNVYSIPVPVTDEIVATLEQTDGTGRDFPWNLMTV